VSIRSASGSASSGADSGYGALQVEIRRVPRHHVDPAVVVAVRVVHEVEVAVYKVIVVVVVRHELVPAFVVVRMRGVARERGVRARVGIRLAEADLVVVDMIFVVIVQMSIMQVVNMVFVGNGSVATPCSVYVWMMSFVHFVSSLVLL